MTSNSQTMSAAIGLSLFLACIPTDNVNAEDEQSLRADNFFAMSDLFGGLTFSPGETIMISSPDAEVFRDFVVPGVDGRLRLGIQSTFLDKNHLKQTVQEQAMRKVDERMRLASYEYLGLLALQHTGESTSDKSLPWAESMATMLTWSKSLSHDVALVGLTELPEKVAYSIIKKCEASSPQFGQPDQLKTDLNKS